MKSKPAYRLFRAGSCATGLFATLLAASTAQAAVYYWNTSATDLWATAASWSDNAISGGTTGTVPSATDAAFFNQSGVNGNKTIQLDAPASVGGIFFANSGTTFIDSNSETSQALTIGAGGIVSTSGAVTIGYPTNPSPIVLGAAQTWTNFSSNPLTVVNEVDNGGNVLTIAGAGGTVINGVISNGGLRTAAFGGTLTLNGTAANTFTGGLTLNGGTLVVDFVNLAGSTPFANLIDSANPLGLGGGTLIVKGRAAAGNSTTQMLGNVTLNAGGGQILGNVNGGTGTTITLGSLTAATAGGSLLVGPNTQTNTTGLTITTSTDKDSQGIYGGRVVFFNGTANTGYDWATSTGAGPYTLSALASGSYATLVPEAASDALNARIAGAGITLTGAHIHNSLKLEGSSGTLGLGANLLTLTSGGLLVTGTTATTISNTAGATGLTAGNGGGAYDLVVHQYNSGALTVAAVIGDNDLNATAFTKAGTGTLILTGTNTYSGPTTITGGTLQVGTGGATGNLGNTTGDLTNNGTLTLNNSGILSLANNIVGIGALNVFTANSTGTVNLAGPNSNYAGKTIINGGTLNLSGNHRGPGGFALRNTSTVNLLAGATETLTGGAGDTGLQLGNQVAGTTVLNIYGTMNLNTVGQDALIGGNSSSVNATVHIGDGGVLNVTNAGIRIANVATTNATIGTVTMDPGSAMTLDTNESSTHGFNLQSNGTGTGAKGTFNLNGGILTTGRVIKVSGSGVAIFNFNGGILRAGVSSTNFLNLRKGGTGALNGSSRANVRNGGAIIDTNGFNITIPQELIHSNVSGDLAIDGGLTKLGSGNLVLAGANTHTGDTLITAGTLELGNNATLQNSAFDPSGAGSLAFSPGIYTPVFGGLTGSANFVISTEVTALTLNVAAGNTKTYSGALGCATPGTPLSLTGAGTQILSGNNTYDGGTTISAGTLVIGHGNALGTTGTITNNATLAIADGVPFARPVTTWGASSVLAGTGTYQPGGTFTAGGLGNCPRLSPGIGTGNVGTLKIGNDLTLDGATLTLDTADTSSYDAVAVQGNLTLSGVNTVAITPPVANGTYDIITYSGGLLAGDASNLTSSVVSATRPGTFTFDTATKGVVKMIVAGAGSNYSLTWGAGSGAWAIPSTGNWTGSDSRFYNGDTVTFDNTTPAGGTVTLAKFSATVALQPAAVSVNNDATHPYTFSGDPISGTGTLTKSGDGTLTLNNSNSYTGDTIINGGKLLLGVATAIPNGTGFGNVALNGGATAAGTLDLNGKSITLNGLSGTTGAVVGQVGNTGAAATLTLGNSNATSAFAGNIANGTGTISLVKLGTGMLTLSGGHTLLVATARNGTLSMTGGSLTTAGTTATGNLVIGDTASTTGNFFISDGTVNVAGSLRSGNLVNSNGNYTQSGGTVNVANELTFSCGAIGSYSSPQSFTLTGGQFNLTATTGDKLWLSNGGGVTTMTVSGGTFTSASTGSSYIGVRGNCPLNISNSGVFNLAGPLSFGHPGGNSQANIVNLGDGINFSGGTSGTLITTAVVRGNGTATFNFNGGTLKAKAASATFMTGLTTTAILAAGAIIDTNTFDITIGQALLTDSVSTGGGLTKTSTGKLTLAGANTYYGATTVNAGTLALGAAATIPNSSGVNVAAGAVFDTSAKAAYAIPAAKPVTLHLNGTGAGSAGRLKAAGLDISTAAVILTIDSPLDDPAYVLADYTSLTGSAFASVTPPLGYTINYAFNGGTQIALVAAATPYDTWAAAKGLDGTPGKEKGPAADPDHDGRNNLEEFAFDGNPLSGANDGKVVGKVATLADTNKVFTLTLPVRTGATFSGTTEQISTRVDGIVYTIQGSDTLAAASWNLEVSEITGADAAAIQSVLPPLSVGWTYRTFRSPGTVTDGDPRDFLRAKVTQP